MNSIEKIDAIPPALNSLQAVAMFVSMFFSHQNIMRWNPFSYLSFTEKNTSYSSLISPVIPLTLYNHSGIESNLSRLIWIVFDARYLPPTAPEATCHP